MTPHSVTWLEDVFGNRVRLTAERLVHILDHPEMKGLESALATVLREPQLVRRSRTDAAVRLFYEFHPQTSVGAKWLCAVIKYLENDAFVSTAYLTNQPKLGEELWPKK
jgi:hypothetical protein